MKKYIAQDRERLDQIIHKEYKSLDKEIVAQVLETNAHLLHKIELQAFDIVYLPEITKKPKKDKSLW